MSRLIIPGKQIWAEENYFYPAGPIPFENRTKVYINKVLIRTYLNSLNGNSVDNTPVAFNSTTGNPTIILEPNGNITEKYFPVMLGAPFIY